MARLPSPVCPLAYLAGNLRPRTINAPRAAEAGTSESCVNKHFSHVGNTNSVNHPQNCILHLIAHHGLLAPLFT